jgi:hypothetical protein
MLCHRLIVNDGPDIDYPLEDPATPSFGDVDIAYQVLGEAPIDLLLFTGSIIPIECMDEEPSMATFSAAPGDL